MNRIFAITALNILFFVGASLFAQNTGEKEGMVEHTTFDPNTKQFTAITATGFIDQDKDGYFLSISENNDRIYFEEAGSDFAKLKANKRFVRISALTYRGKSGYYCTDSWGLVKID